MKPQTLRVLNLLRTRGPHGLDATEFQPPFIVDHGKPIGRLAARILELRQSGFEITSCRLADNTAHYTLVNEPAVQQTPSEAKDPPPMEQASPGSVVPSGTVRLAASTEPLFDTRAYQDQAAA